LLAEGVRDGAAARAASDTLYTDRRGKVICTLNIASIDLHSGTIVLTRNNPSPIYVCRYMEMDRLDTESIPLGTSRDVRPSITELRLEVGLVIVIYTDGLVHAGARRGNPMNTAEVLRSMMEDQDPGPQEVADTLLAHAVALDENRPADDISVLVLKVASRNGDNVRRMSVRLPIDGVVGGL
jgi:serine phosphatase RsbU (regulator of sigma subunit)